jgi:hypothetical protein
LGTAHAGKAQALSRLGRHAEALKECRALAESGKHALAVPEAVAVAAQAPQAGDILYLAASVCARAAASVLKDAKLPQAERDKLAEQYAARAVEILRTCKGTRFFAHRGHLDDLKTAEEFQPLRGRTDFQKLLKECIEKPQPESKGTPQPDREAVLQRRRVEQR